MEHSSENTKERRSFNKTVLFAVLALLALIIGISIAVTSATSEKRIMAPGPIGSTDSVSKPLS